MTLSAQSPNCCLMLPPIVLLSSLLLSADCCDTEKMAAWEGVNIDLAKMAKWKYYGRIGSGSNISKYLIFLQVHIFYFKCLFSYAVLAEYSPMMAA